MKISRFLNLKDTIPQRYSIDVLEYLSDIKNGKYINEVKALRFETNKEKKDNIKKSFGAVTFGGVFSTRNKKGLKEASGLVILDFDKLDNANDFREDLKGNDFIFSAWVSPSGNGVKALVKIPIVTSSDQYTAYYTNIVSQFHYKGIDLSGKDVSRLCFDSYDSDLWINEDSQIWLEFDTLELDLPIYHTDLVSVPMNDEDEIISKLLKWFEKHYNPNERNNSINKLAFSFNCFGITFEKALEVCLRYEQKDFRFNEIKATVLSAYKNKTVWNTRQFQDQKRKDSLVNFSRRSSIEEIKKKFPDVSDETIKEIKENSKNVIFWSQNEKGTISIIPSYFRDYLHDNGINKILFNDNKNVVSFIRQDGKFVEEFSSEMIKDFVLSDMENNCQMDVWNELANKSKYFEDKFLSMVDSKIVDTDKDGEDYSLFYFLNCVVKVEKDKVTKLDYSQLEKYVWKEQVIQRNYKEVDHHKCDFRSFIWYACGQSKENYNTFKSVIGRLLHGYKSMSGNRAIIANDENLSDEPNGGSGKSLLFEAVGQLRKVVSIDGKSFNFKEKFNYQTVSIDTQVLVFDDIEKNFEFERLFSIITSGITLEYKNQNATKLNVTESPHIYLTTNYAVKGNGGSFERRKFEIEFSSFFGANNTPEDVFGKRFFDEWNEEEWATFDNFMINCLQYFLENGLVGQSHKTLREKKFKTETNTAWFEFVTKHHTMKIDERYYKPKVKNAFFEINDHFKDLSTQSITKWARAYANFKGFIFVEDRDSTGHYFEFKSSVEESKEDDLIDFNFN